MGLRVTARYSMVRCRSLAKQLGWRGDGLESEYQRWGDKSSGSSPCAEPGLSGSGGAETLNAFALMRTGRHMRTPGAS